ncbi:hypothetical protein E3N88_39135 [Mikania micrantha]|uniref:Uncharacterized protein n=1 Tax=Mikania micrantha TaxID=192012 RepID=A0A5N6LVY6_9ASTR|nr:hypothetical protein E3N88_39135 [Mikania micrantha]
MYSWNKNGALSADRREPEFISRPPVLTPVVRRPPGLTANGAVAGGICSGGTVAAASGGSEQGRRDGGEVFVEGELRERRDLGGNFTPRYFGGGGGMGRLELSVVVCVNGQEERKVIRQLFEDDIHSSSG